MRECQPLKLITRTIVIDISWQVVEQYKTMKREKRIPRRHQHALFRYRSTRPPHPSQIISWHVRRRLLEQSTGWIASYYLVYFSIPKIKRMKKKRRGIKFNPPPYRPYFCLCMFMHSTPVMISLSLPLSFSWSTKTHYTQSIMQRDSG